jgi:hypothetical protein
MSSTQRSQMGRKSPSGHPGPAAAFSLASRPNTPPSHLLSSISSPAVSVLNTMSYLTTPSRLSLRIPTRSLTSLPNLGAISSRTASSNTLLTLDNSCRTSTLRGTTTSGMHSNSCGALVFASQSGQAPTPLNINDYLHPPEASVAHEPRASSPREHRPREHHPREHRPREPSPRAHSPREHSPRE